MATTGLSIIVITLFAPLFVAGDSCVGPSVQSKYYVTREAAASVDTVFIVEFQLTCKNGLKNMNLYADVNGKLLPVTKTDDSKNKYQVSYSDENKNLPAGHYDVRFYDEEGYAILRKAQRSGETNDSIKPLFTIPINHPGVWKGPIVQSEFIAVVVAILVWYVAHSAKSHLQSDK
ncbi:hypothetical protein CHS0354_029679 [Potamilus streckersoni]|uniref:Translocon-associated protein subunit delta n=1 Tax=Potamilus streckersoni TaxID=2493646 RepID=A0AAE0VJR2_9BIVA|nr:hypothetical protein CHS0354_029679 [Potamilus streckersoni]